MRVRDWLLVVGYLAGVTIFSCLAYYEGIVSGREEMAQTYSRHVRELNRMIDHDEIRAMLAEGRK